MLCSTIIPTVNRPSLERAVKSVLEQDLNSGLHEIIVVNDSGQPLPEVKWLKSPQITVVNTNRCERSVACNVGAAISRGKYLKILHDDDYLLPGALRALIDVAEATGCYWVYGAINRVDNNDAFISVDRPDIEGNVLSVLVGGECLHPAASLINRQAFFEVGGFDRQLKVREDFDLQSRLALLSDFGRTDHLVANVRVGEQGSTTDWSRVTQEHRQVREKTLSAAGALPRLYASVESDVFERGHACRSILFSAVLNYKAGRFFTGCSRLLTLIRLTKLYPLKWGFWQGLKDRSHWHSVEKQREEAHYAEHYSSSSTPPIAKPVEFVSPNSKPEVDMVLENPKQRLN